MQVNIISFGQIREIMGEKPVLLSDVKDTDQLKQYLKKTWPQLEGLPFILAVDKNIVNKNTALHAGETIAILPPYSGG